MRDAEGCLRCARTLPQDAAVVAPVAHCPLHLGKGQWRKRETTQKWRKARRWRQLGAPPCDNSDLRAMMGHESDLVRDRAGIQARKVRKAQHALAFDALYAMNQIVIRARLA